ncbi:LipL41-expression chaperone Lep [Leptospira yasudae]|uniref:LipL41-expression chaperone Lep n=1 Tax=Leptospira yasudae TaxID=2202201 RepID=A0A5F2AW76_9LEPT|nr:LipL41-expression chaperone Lep [Leptospira yasudae]RHX95934.1 LipL41-expression chaperone Lep [Leptospira yasudae]TGK29745.1 LipL41-expression chaperone Lep [Leptospira yasudae]TGL76997.1 LipL41-expression chaperone Lep [Leptospira yasudae]TGL83949.1 LipL41-expression chaperone Lep [Leptospira yasudae]TGL89967.1 LipL41-expression chaperone Lep [Leptospira yasudae]
MTKATRNKPILLNRISFWKSGRKSAFLISISILSFLFLADCRKTPKEEECVQNQMHNVKLIAQATEDEIPSGMQQLMLKQILQPDMSRAIVLRCMSDKTLKQVQCELEKEKFSELKECKKFGKEEVH